MRTVFVIQEVNGKNLLPAKDHGELNVILSGHETAEVATAKLRYAISAMTSADFLLLIGSPRNIAIAGHLALTKLKDVNFLIWDRNKYSYNVERITTNAN